ncbi:hypothetical protein CF98_05380 [Halopseudomonas bauzanensis]|nr:hypothetical protein CF98_05380 [Halopseudomonas bauzanensis]
MISLAIYLGGIGSLLLCDILVTRSFSEEDIALWAEVRSLIGISGILCLVGLEQVLMRSRRSSARLLQLLAIQIPILSIVVGSLLWFFGFLNYWLIAVLLGGAAASSSALAQYYRSHYMSIASQLAQQLWKCLALIAIVIVLMYEVKVEVDALVVGIMVFSVMLVAVFIFRYTPGSLFPQDPQGYAELYMIGSRFMVTALLLSLAIYGEQLLVNKLGGASDGAQYFTHATYFLFPVSVFNGYFAFVIAPWVRDNHDKYINILKEKYFLIILSAFGYSMFISFIGWLGWLVVRPAVGMPNLFLQMIFFWVCFFRTIYMLPSAYIGVFGRPRQHDILIAGQAAALIIAVLLLFFLKESGWLELVTIVALASAVNWGLRVMAGFGVTGIIERSRRGYE